MCMMSRPSFIETASQLLSSHRHRNAQDDADLLRIATAVLDYCTRTEAEDASQRIFARADGVLKYLGPAVFEGVNPVHPLWPGGDFELLVANHYDTLKDGKSIHLELGPSVAWPSDRVQQKIEHDRLGDFIRLDMDLSCPIDVRGSVTAMPFADESIDYIYSNSLFEHCAYPHEIIREAFRVLRPGGAMFAKTPFHFVEHRFPADYLRYSEQFFQDVCSDAGFADVHTESKSTSGIYYTVHQLIKAGVVNQEHPESHTAQRAHTLITILLAALQAMDGSFHAHGQCLWHTTATLAIKAGQRAPRATGPNRDLAFVDRYTDILICPKSGLPLRRGDQHYLVSLDGSNRYQIINGVPDLFVLHGFGSSFAQRASSQTRVAEFSARNLQTEA